MGKQTLGKNGQVILTSKRCPHGVFRDDRGNSACEECYDNRQTSSYLLGIAAAFEEMVLQFTKRAGEEFSAGKDDRAQFYRELAKEAEAHAKSRRQDQVKHDKTFRWD